MACKQNWDHDWVSEVDDDHTVVYCAECGKVDRSDDDYDDSSDPDCDKDLWTDDDWLDDLMGQV